MSNGMNHATEYSEQLAAAAKFIEQHDDFLVVSHIQPDGDAARSTYAMVGFLNNWKNVYNDQ